MHTEEKLSHRLLITAASTDKTSVTLISSKSVRRNEGHLPQNNQRWNIVRGRRLGTDWTSFSLSGRQVCLFWSPFRSCVDVFIYLWVWWGNPQRIQFSPPHEEPCHIYIFLIAHNSASPGLTRSIKSLRPTSNSPLHDSSEYPSLTRCCPGTKIVST